MENCIFCKVIAGALPSDKIYESDTVLVIEDKFPQAPKHYLILPKQHLDGVTSLGMDDEKMIGDMYHAAREVAKKKGLDNSGFRLVINHGVNGGQTIFHLHMHMLGGRPMHWPPG